MRESLRGVTRSGIIREVTELPLIAARFDGLVLTPSDVADLINSILPGLVGKIRYDQRKHDRYGLVSLTAWKDIR